MRVESVAKSIQMLKGILDGKTYTLVAQESGLSRSAVEQRVKALARDLQTVVGVEWVDADEVPTLQGLRARKENYLEALEHYHPQRVANAPKGPRALTDQDIDRAAAVIRQHSNCRKRDAALLLVLFSTAAKPLEIARLEVSDYLSEDGSVREASVLRADAAINGKERPLFFASTKVVAAVDAYSEERGRRGQGTKASTKYRGLDPEPRGNVDRHHGALFVMSRHILALSCKLGRLERWSCRRPTPAKSVRSTSRVTAALLAFGSFGRGSRFTERCSRATRKLFHKRRQIQ